MKLLFLATASLLVLGGGAASAASLSCRVDQGDDLRVQLSGEPHTRSASLELSPGLVATASRHPGYGMMFHDLSIELDGVSLGEARAWLPDDLGQRNLSHFGALSLQERAGERTIRCSYTLLD